MSDEQIVSFQNDFAYSPLLFAHVIRDKKRAGVVAAGGAVFSVITLAVAGPWLGAIALLMTVNDTLCLTGKRKEISPPKDLFRLKGGAWQLAGSTPAALPSVADPEAIPVSSTVVHDSPEPVDRPVPKPNPNPVHANSDPANFMPRAEFKQEAPVAANFSSNPWNNPPRTPVPAYEPEGIPDENLTDWEREQEAIIQERVDAALAKEKAGSATQTDPQGIVNELFVKEDGYYRSWFIMGITGSGKGVFLCYALIVAQAKMPGVSIWVVEPKADPLEYSRWAFLPENQRYHYEAMQPTFSREDVIRIKAGIQRVLNGYAADKSEYKLLIIDELPAILRSLGESARSTLKYLNAIASMGRSRNNLVWLFSNAIGLQQNGITAGDRDYYQTLYLATPSKLSPIVDYDKFKGARIESSDPVFASTGRAALASTKSNWEPIPNSYYEVVSRLPKVQPPTNFGTGSFERSEEAVELATMAEELRDVLEESGLNRGCLADLLRETSYESLSEKPGALPSLADGLRGFPDIIEIRKNAKGFAVALPKPPVNEPASSAVWEPSFL
jgi:hypothetical protein